MIANTDDPKVIDKAVREIFDSLIAQNMTNWDAATIFACGFCVSLRLLPPGQRASAINILAGTLERQGAVSHFAPHPHRPGGRRPPMSRR